MLYLLLRLKKGTQASDNQLALNVSKSIILIRADWMLYVTAKNALVKKHD